MDRNENTLVGHIQAFRKKYYANQILRGSIFLLLIVSSILFISILGEGLLGFSSGVRTGLFFGLLTVFLLVLGRMVLWPLSKMVNLSQGLTDMEIARIVRRHFPNIDDKLINLLELKGNSSENNALAIAAIEQKTNELAPVPFANAINFRVNFKYARYLLVPLLLFALFFIVTPRLMMDGSTRLINFKKEFVAPPPFSIQIQNHPDQLIAGQDYKLQTHLKGEELPKELYLYLKKDSEEEFVSYPMNSEMADKFFYEFNDLKENFEYFIGNEKVKSDKLDVTVLKRPSIKRFRVLVEYPGYTGLGTDTLSENIGDFKVLKGSKLTWMLEAAGDLDRVVYVGRDTSKFTLSENGEFYQHQRRLLEDEQYFISLTSKQRIQNIDTVRYHIDVITDRFPSVFVDSPGQDFQADFNMSMPLDFEISDDYGFSKLSLFYRFVDSENDDKKTDDYQEVSLDVKKRELLQRKAFELDLDGLGMEEGDRVEYFIKVWDNDFITGPKFSVSSVFTINYLSLEEKYEEAGENQEKMDKMLKEMQEKAEELNEGYKKMEEKLLNQKKLSYDDRKELKKMLEQQQSVREEMSMLQKELEKNKEMLENNSMISQRTLEKYEKLNDFLKDMDNPKLDEMMKKMQENMEKLDPEDIKKNLEQMKLDEEEIEKSIERTMELLKQLEVQQKIEETLNKLENLKDKQEMLNEKLEDTNKNNKEAMDKLAEKQKELEKEMEKIKEELKELEEMKKDTETPDEEEMGDLEKDAEETQEDMQESEQQMQEGKKKEGSESQKNAQKKMEQMIQKLQDMQFGDMQQQDQANLDNLREILENLLALSFDQEDLRDEVKELRYGDPQLVKKGQSQKELQDDMEMVQDSLEELAKKVFEIEKFILDESGKAVEAMESSQDFIRNKQTNEVVNRQTQAMTSINNLANMLSDVMQSMQQQMKSNKPGQGMCKKPGGNGKPSMQQLGKQQGKLNGQMQEMLKGMEGGKGTDPGKLAKMAAEQEAIRKALQEAHDQIQKEGGKALGSLGQIASDMKDTEDELKRNNITRETLNRQQQILNRLLDATKAVREKEEFENRRQSTTGNDEDRVSPEELSKEEYKNMLRQELLKSNQLEYSNDFIILIEKYFKLLDKGN
ncbi:MAG: hypothetical protein H6581_07385 [Bacteroidia bacterium]|nr:hypothetical protein [Bacteroidia bacterium]